MSQICPDCKKEFLDSSNYCDICAAKLPNAEIGTPDYKSGQKFSEAEVKRLEKYMSMKLKDPIFLEKLVTKILIRVMDGHDEDSKCEKYLSSEIIEIFRLELIENLESK
jgi:predicted amidophosphoribosyltransferase